MRIECERLAACQLKFFAVNMKSIFDETLPQCWHCFEHSVRIGGFDVSESVLGIPVSVRTLTEFDDVLTLRFDSKAVPSRRTALNVMIVVMPIPTAREALHRAIRRKKRVAIGA